MFASQLRPPHLIGRWTLYTPEIIGNYFTFQGLLLMELYKTLAELSNRSADKEVVPSKVSLSLYLNSFLFFQLTEIISLINQGRSM